MRLYVTPASPWVRRVRVTILELGIEDRFEFVQTRWPHSWGTQTVAMPADFTAATPVMRIPALVTDEVTLTDSHAICDYLNAEFGNYRLLTREGAARWQALSTIALANSVIEAQIMRRAETLRSDKERSDDFITKMRDRTFRCFAALEKHLPAFSAARSTWRRSRRPSPAATKTGATVATGAAPRQNSPLGTIPSPNGRR